MLEGRVVIGECGCWIIRDYGSHGMILRSYLCPKHIRSGLDNVEKMLYLDRVGSVSAMDEDEGQLWLT